MAKHRIVALAIDYPYRRSLAPRPCQNRQFLIECSEKKQQSRGVRAVDPFLAHGQSIFGSIVIVVGIVLIIYSVYPICAYLIEAALTFG